MEQTIHLIDQGFSTPEMLTPSRCHPLAQASQQSVQSRRGGQRISSSSSSSSVDLRLGPCKMSASSSFGPALSSSSSSSTTSSSCSNLTGAEEGGGSGEGDGTGESEEASTTSPTPVAPAPSSGRLQPSAGGGGPPGFFLVEVVLRKLASGGRSCTPDLVCPSMAFCSWGIKGNAVGENKCERWGSHKGKTGQAEREHIQKRERKKRYHGTSQGGRHNKLCVEQPSPLPPTQTLHSCKISSTYNPLCPPPPALPKAHPLKTVPQTLNPILSTHYPGKATGGPTCGGKLGPSQD